MIEKPAGEVAWVHPRRGKQRLTVLVTGEHQHTVVLRHDDEQVGAKRTYMPVEKAQDLGDILAAIEETIAAQEARAAQVALEFVDPNATLELETT